MVLLGGKSATFKGFLQEFAQGNALSSLSVRLQERVIFLCIRFATTRGRRYCKFNLKNNLYRDARHHRSSHLAIGRVTGHNDWMEPSVIFEDTEYGGSPAPI